MTRTVATVLALALASALAVGIAAAWVLHNGGVRV